MIEQFQRSVPWAQDMSKKTVQPMSQTAPNSRKLITEALDGLIEEVVGGVRRAKGSARESGDGRSFSHEVARIMRECEERYLRMFLRDVPQTALRELYHSNEARIAVARMVVELVEDHIVPKLRTIDRCGDMFSYWMELKRTTKEFGQLYDEIAKKHGIFGFEDISAILAVIALTVQAQTDMEAGNDTGAWSSLVDASYWLGAINGGRIGFYTGSRHGSTSSATARAKANAEKKNEPNVRIKALAVELLHSRRPPLGWPTIGAAAAALRPYLQAECDLINEELTQTGKKRIALVADRTVQGWFRGLDEHEKLGLFASARQHKAKDA